MYGALEQNQIFLIVVMVIIQTKVGFNILPVMDFIVSLVRTMYCIRTPDYVVLASCRDGEVRLTEGENELEGRLEMCFNQRWGTVSDDGGWSEASAQVVCSDLGYEINPSQCTYI